MSARKRVRFSDKVDEKHISEDEKHESEEEDDAEEDVDDKEPDEPTIVAGATMEDLISQLEPARRKAFLHDLGAAEEDYLEPDELFNDMGVPIEPFHLRREREEGFFTDDGCFVWHKAAKDAEPDAWVDALPDDPDDSEEEGAVPMDEGSIMPADVAMQHRRGVVELLLPGETVVRALQRMGGTARPRGPAGRSAAWREELQQGLQRGRTVPQANKVSFDRLVALSDALMASGDMCVYTDTREQLQGRCGEGNGQHHQQHGGRAVDPEEDMFAQEEEEAQQDTAEDLPSSKRRTVQGTPGGPVEDAPTTMEDPEVGSSGRVEDGGTEEEGFVLDEASGLLYNSEKGLFFDPGSQRFRDANTGQWFAAAARC